MVQSRYKVVAVIQSLMLTSMIVKHFVVIEEFVILIVVHHPVAVIAPKCRTLRSS